MEQPKHDFSVYIPELAKEGQMRSSASGPVLPPSPRGSDAELGPARRPFGGPVSSWVDNWAYAVALAAFAYGLGVLLGLQLNELAFPTWFAATVISWATLGAWVLAHHLQQRHYRLIKQQYADMIARIKILTEAGQ